MTMLDIPTRPRLEIVVQERMNPKPDLHYRRNESARTYTPVSSPHHAEALLSSTTFDSPWVTIVRGEPGGDSIYFQILGTPDRLVAEGGGVHGASRWNWRATALPGEWTPTTAGPPWYELDAYRSDLITADDTRRMLWPALANDLAAMRHQAGMRALFYR
jgi:hypothetical protein